MRDEAGSFALQAVIVLAVLVAAIGLGLDTGLMLLKHRKLQKAVDSAAIAALAGGVKTTVVRLSEAQAVMAYQGFGTASTTITLNQPPLTGAYSGKSDNLEIIAQATYTPYFGQLLGVLSVPLKARAVAGGGSRSYGCLLALSTTSTKAFYAKSSVIDNAGCELNVNSTSTTAAYIEVQSSVSGPVNIVGGLFADGTSSFTGTPLVTGSAPIANPYQSRTIPTQTTTCVSGNTSYQKSGNGKATNELSPGYYCNGITLQQGGTIVNLAAGIYYIGTKFDMQQGSTMNANTGVTLIIIPGATISFANNSTLNITAPNSGTTAGWAIASATTTGPVQILNGAAINLVGAIYFPNVEFQFTGTAKTGITQCNQIIAQKITIGGNLTFRSNCANTGVTPIGKVAPTIVE